MAKNILIINGPNLNMLGQREPEIYGSETLSDIEDLCKDQAGTMDFTVQFKQSNHEGEIVTWIQQTLTKEIDALMINAGAYTHTSIAIHDALKLLSIPIVEVHLSDPHKRESFRHVSYIESVAAKVFKGHGAKSYSLALNFLDEHFNN